MEFDRTTILAGRMMEQKAMSPPSILQKDCLMRPQPTMSDLNSHTEIVWAKSARVVWDMGRSVGDKLSFRRGVP